LWLLMMLSHRAMIVTLDAAEIQSIQTSFDGKSCSSGSHRTYQRAVHSQRWFSTVHFGRG
jgi:hypothetical protein